MGLMIGFTCGTFDLLHAGHCLMLEEARQQCDYLIVGLQTDPTIDRNHKTKPVQSVLERYIQLISCKYVDEVVPYDTEEDLMIILKNFNIDIRIIGYDYYGKEFTGKDLGIPIFYNSRRHTFSSTELRKRIKNENF